MKIKDKKQHFYLLFPNIFGFKGGIQVYSAFLLQTLQSLYPLARYNVFLKYDSQSNTDSQFLQQTQFHCFGDWQKQLQNLLFATKTIWLGIWQRPTLVIATHVNYSIACYWLKRLTGIPYWVVVHGLEAWNLQNPLHQAALRYADQIVAVSQYTRNRLLKEQQLEGNKIAVLPNTFSAKHFNIAPKPKYLQKRYRLKPEQPIILTVTRLGRSAIYKGYDQILQALVKVRDRFPDIHYILVGKGDDTPRIKALINNLNLQDCVTLTGFVSDEELCDHYNLCDVFALPSIGEGFGIVYLEALACGKPIIAGNRDGAVDPLVQGTLGCLINPNDVEAISKSLIQILDGSHPNPLMYQPQVLRQKAIERFELAQFRETLFKLVDNDPHIEPNCI
ncbi:glycosyltransferase [Coleofasciculus sp. FACHB-129]|uniref:glycosyltransferase n=1 Tax=Cyanophyceae TaxID=3028117 RepID=UPI0016831F77|nr:glycosyltransferase [Coleofasciculus sp. FACHB-129]MBD1895744.1 glycosyltransferase [Coleofasciculus sp. FACHB-129]